SRSAFGGSVWSSATRIHGSSGRAVTANSASASHVNSVSGAGGAVRASSQPAKANVGSSRGSAQRKKSAGARLAARRAVTSNIPTRHPFPPSRHGKPVSFRLPSLVGNLHHVLETARVYHFLFQQEVA